VSAENKALTRRYFHEVWNEGDAEAIAELIHPDYMGHDPSIDDLLGPDGMQAQTEATRRAFPDVRFDLHEVVAEGDLVAVRWTASGTHRGPFFDIPGTGNSVEISGLSMLRFQNGKIVEGWLERETLGILRQITGEEVFDGMFRAMSGRARLTGHE
jgi:steroid delta-isomerase-like uncharacterized protein